MIEIINKFETLDKQTDMMGKRVLTQDQANIFKSIIATYKTSKIAVVTGQGGSGKSVILMAIKKYCDANGISCAVTASTGKAASNVNGVTVHSYLGLSMKENMKADSVDEAFKLSAKEDSGNEIPDILIVEEFSMVGMKLMNEIEKKRFPFVLYFGDATQAKPVKDKMVDWKYIAGDNYYTLTKNLRAKNEALANMATDYRLQKEGQLSGLKLSDYVNGDSIIEVNYRDLEALPLGSDSCFIGYRNKLVEKFSNILTHKRNNMYNLNVGVTVTKLEVDKDLTQNSNGYYKREFKQEQVYYNGEDVEIEQLDSVVTRLKSNGKALYGKWSLKLTKKGIMITDVTAKKESWEAESKAPKYYINFPVDDVLEYCTLSVIEGDTFTLVWDGTEDEFKGMTQHYFSELHPYLKRQRAIDSYYKGSKDVDLSILPYDIRQAIVTSTKKQFNAWFEYHAENVGRKSKWSDLLNATKVVSARPTSSRTILKAQGMSIPVAILCDDSFYGAADDAKYVAVSRARQAIIIIKDVPNDWK